MTLRFGQLSLLCSAALTLLTVTTAAPASLLHSSTTRVSAQDTTTTTSNFVAPPQAAALQSDDNTRVTVNDNFAGVTLQAPGEISGLIANLTALLAQSAARKATVALTQATPEAAQAVQTPGTPVAAQSQVDLLTPTSSDGQPQAGQQQSDSGTTPSLGATVDLNGETQPALEALVAVNTNSASTLADQTANNTTGQVYREPFVLGDPLASMLPFLPALGEWIFGATDKIQALDIGSITKTYTQRDWARWDAYEPVWAGWLPAQRPAPLSGTTAMDVYSFLFNSVHAQQFFTVGYNWYFAFGLSSYSITDTLVKNNNFDTPTVMHNASYGINQAYNLYRTEWLNSNGQNYAGFDKVEVPWTSLKIVQQTMSWLEDYITKLQSTQSLSHVTVQRPNSPFPAYDSYGLFSQNGGFNSGAYDQFGHIFFAPPYGQLLSHYTHLFSTEFLRKARTSIRASLTALNSALTTFGTGEQGSTAQWMTRVTGVITHANFLVLSERELRLRQVWSDALDGVARSDLQNGQWTNADAIGLANTITSTFVTRLQKFGINEYSSTYYSFTLDMVAIALLHAPTEYLYSSVEFIYRMIFYDVASNFMPQAGVLSASTARHYDQWIGGHGGFDGYDMRQYVQIVFSPQCRTLFTQFAQPQVAARLAAGSVNSCLSSLQANSPSQALQFTMNRVQWSSRQAAGYGYLPLDVFQAITLAAPMRTVEQKFSPARGMERNNFITPLYTIGHAADNLEHTSANVLLVARFAGTPNPSYPIYGQNSNAIPWLRTMLVNQDDPFANPDGVVGLNIQLSARQLVTQYQSYQLITQLAVPGQAAIDGTKDQGWKSLTSNYLIPLSVDQIYVDGYVLPRTVNTTIALPLNAIVSVAQGNASFALRLLYAEFSPASTVTMRTATSVQYSSNITAAQPGVGQHPYTYMWQVDPSSFAQGFGRLIVHHKHKDLDLTNSGQTAYRVSWLLGGGQTRNWADIRALQAVLRQAQYTQTLTDMPKKDQYVVRATRWQASVRIGSTAGQIQTLGVDRNDIYTTWNNEPNFKYGNGVFYTPPYYMATFNRTVNGQEILTFDGVESSFRVKAVSASTWFQPHLTTQQVSMYRAAVGETRTQALISEEEASAGAAKLVEGQSVPATPTTAGDDSAAITVSNTAVDPTTQSTYSNSNNNFASPPKEITKTDAKNAPQLFPESNHKMNPTVTIAIACVASVLALFLASVGTQMMLKRRRAATKLALASPTAAAQSSSVASTTTPIKQLGKVTIVNRSAMTTPRTEASNPSTTTNTPIDPVKASAVRPKSSLLDASSTVTSRSQSRRTSQTGASMLGLETVQLQAPLEQA